MTDIRLPTGQAAALRDGIVVVAGPAGQHHYRLIVERGPARCEAKAATMPELLDLASQMESCGYALVTLERLAGKAP